MDTYHQGDLARVYLHSRRSMPPLCALMRQCAHFPPCMPQRKSQFGAASFADSKQECPRPELHHSRIRVMVHLLSVSQLALTSRIQGRTIQCEGTMHQGCGRGCTQGDHPA
eukprot:scaffold16278_cov17-Tisochrysis_lutea.AAC.2